VIDHTDNLGRVLVKYLKENEVLRFSFQDDNRTLKILIEEKTKVNDPHPFIEFEETCAGYIAEIKSVSGIVVHAGTKEEAFREAIISLAVKLAYDYQIPLREPIQLK
jgi:hypothetical protein